MKKIISSFHLLIWITLLLLLSGCEMITPPTTYEAAPTKISYDITYGYHVTTTGSGRYELSYFCDTPRVLIGTITYTKLHNTDFETKNLFNNTVIHWNISSKDVQTYELGITASVEAESYIVTDLNGKDALTLQQIQERYPKLVNQYTGVQENDTTRFIDPENPQIKNIADTIYTKEKTNNSFLMAKALFSWLKQNIIYQVHPEEPAARPAIMTLSTKQGDCDDISFLYISLCRALDIPARFIRGYLITDEINGTVTATPHAWTEVYVGQPGLLNGWIPIECACCTPSIITDINQNFGVESASHLRLFTDGGSNASLETSLSGISYITHDPNITITLDSYATITQYQELQSKKLIITNNNIRHYE
jgi:transglutaminase-like putative cysteine protease